jgi:hypothetical protein
MYLKLHILPLDFLIKPAAQVLRPHLRQSRYLPGALPCDIRSEAAIRRSHQSENSSSRQRAKNKKKNDQNRHNSAAGTRVQDELIALLTRAQRLKRVLTSF